MHAVGDLAGFPLTLLLKIPTRLAHARLPYEASAQQLLERVSCLLGGSVDWGERRGFWDSFASGLL